MTGATDRAGVLGRLGVSRETSERLDAFVAILEHWSTRINLVARSTLPDVWSRHIEDSAQLWRDTPPTARRWLDLGSGAGFPGLVIAAIAAERMPALTVQLVEADTRKAAFLGAAAREMGLALIVSNARIEGLHLAPADVISARALAPLEQLCALAAPLLAPGGICLFPKGAAVASELTKARQSWHAEIITHRSVTDPAAVILELRELRSAAARQS